MNDKPKIDERLTPPMSREGLYSVATVGGPPEVIRNDLTPGTCVEPIQSAPVAIENKPSDNGQPQSAMIDLAHTRFIVTAWPDHRWPLEIVRWIEGLMVGVTPARPDYRASVKKQNVVCARNWAIKNEALGSDPSYEWFVFADRDVRPRPGVETSRFLALDADVKSCQVEHGNKSAYSWPDDFHEPIWCTSREVLDTIEPPWFMQAYNDDGTEMDGCICQSFRKKVLDAKFTIAHGGWADHDRDGSWCG